MLHVCCSFSDVTLRIPVYTRVVWLYRKFEQFWYCNMSSQVWQEMHHGYNKCQREIKRHLCYLHTLTQGSSMTSAHVPQDIYRWGPKCHKVPQRYIYLIIVFVSEHLSSATKNDSKCHMQHLCRYLRKPALTLWFWYNEYSSMLVNKHAPKGME